MVGMVLGSCLWGGEECLQDSSLFCTHMVPLAVPCIPAVLSVGWGWLHSRCSLSWTQ